MTAAAAVVVLLCSGFLARDLAPPFELLAEVPLQYLQYQVSGMLLRLTLAQVRWTQV